MSRKERKAKNQELRRNKFIKDHPYMKIDTKRKVRNENEREPIIKYQEEQVFTIKETITLEKQLMSNIKDLYKKDNTTGPDKITFHTDNFIKNLYSIISIIDNDEISYTELGELCVSIENKTEILLNDLNRTYFHYYKIKEYTSYTINHDIDYIYIKL